MFATTLSWVMSLPMLDGVFDCCIIKLLVPNKQEYLSSNSQRCFLLISGTRRHLSASMATKNGGRGIGII